MNAVILSRVQNVGADVFSLPIAQLNPESSPDTVESWDSLGHLNLVLALEREFDVQIGPDEIDRMDSIQAIAGLIEKKLKRAADSL
jgi:acyl carrier protein